MPANLKVSLNIYRGISIQSRCREKRIEAEDSPHIRDLFHQKYRGSRYSFGYPACPNLEDQTKLFVLLKGGKRRSASDQRILARARTVDVGDRGSSSGG
jgi:Vitamin B12 dependent methionine synthase, activation domain